MNGTSLASKLPSAVSTTSYNAANQLTAWGGATLLYDANGNLTSDGSNTYTWDSRQRLSTLTGTTSGSFSYDAVNRRSQKTIAGQTTSYVFDGINLVQELTGAGTPTVQANLLTGGIDEVFSRTEAGGSTYSYLADALGSTQALTDSTGASTTQYTYDPYGQTSSSGSASANSQQYTGRENDGTGLYYYRARYYSPGFGRFISGDPIGLAGGVNTYTYVKSNPINSRDPLGLWTLQIGLSYSLSYTIFSAGLGGTAGFGGAIDGNGNITAYGFYGGGGTLGTPGVSSGVQVAMSNGNSVCDLAGPFSNVSLGGGWGPDATGDAFWGAGSEGQMVTGAGWTLGVGVGGGAFAGQTNTILGPIGHLW
ncbi:RHS repeat-associated core domain-containing protein [Pseudomonas batumici]|uniref:RHS repeat-associated core domain-containing protein n=1 Tax=Pseudomonas batumici TaxID=226910 RepID=UPI0030D4A4F2